MIHIWRMDMCWILHDHSDVQQGGKKSNMFEADKSFYPATVKYNVYLNP